MPDSALDALDLRDYATGQYALRLTNSTAHAAFEGYQVGAQRRSQTLDGTRHKALAIRLNAPDGRVLYLTAPIYHGAGNAHGPVTAALSAEIGHVFRPTATDAHRATCAERIEAVITTGHRLLAQRLHGAQARLAIQAAAHALPLDQVTRWQPAPRSAAVKPADIARMARAGFTAADGGTWLDYLAPADALRRVPNLAVLKRIATFRNRGWTPAAFHDLRTLCAYQVAAQQDPALTREEHARQIEAGTARLDPEPPPAAWTRIDPAAAMTGAALGMDLAEIKTMLADGTWDQAAMATLAALSRGAIR